MSQTVPRFIRHADVLFADETFARGLNTSAYAKIGTKAQMNPLLKSERDNEILWQALKDGAIVFMATDRAPHTLEEKAQTYPTMPSGRPGVETSLPVMLTQVKEGRCTVEQVLRWMLLNPANG